MGGNTAAKDGFTVLSRSQYHQCRLTLAFGDGFSLGSKAVWKPVDSLRPCHETGIVDGTVCPERKVRCEIVGLACQESGWYSSLS